MDDTTENDPMIGELKGDRVPVTLSWKNIVYTITQKSGPLWNRQSKDKILLNDVSGIVKPGQLLAIMGSTGAGKSTLLDVLVGYKNTGRLDGEILINGEPRNKMFKRMAGYVTQDDCQMDTLTVRETLQFYADLRLPSHITKQERERRVQTIIEELRLQKCAESYIGSQFRRGISGGERKRVSIGCELITDPGLLFLDEPTTGLDAYNSFAIMELLNTLTKNGRTIVCTIHQPRSAIFELFDQLMLLSQGKVVYFGAAKQAVQYFGSLGVQCGEFSNPADFFIDMVIENERQRDGLIECVGEPLDLPNSYINSSFFAEALDTISAANTGMTSNNEPLPELDSEYATGLWAQFKIIAVRSLKHLRRNPVTAYVQFFQTCFMAFLIGSIFFRLPLTQNGLQDRNGALFFILTNQSFAALASLNLFLAERNLFNRERASGTYRTSAYYLSKCAVEGVFQLIFPIAFSFVVYWLVGLQTPAFGLFLATLVLTSAVSSSLFINIGAISPTQQIATIMAPIIVVLFLLFGGFYLNLDSFPVYYRWFGYLSFFRYAFEILAKAEFSGLVFNCTPGVQQCTPTGEQQLANLSMTDVDYASCFLILLAMMVFYRVMAYFSLAYLFKEKR
jgi:ATP-binding cassette subfamily G (WHITE) protein 2